MPVPGIPTNSYVSQGNSTVFVGWDLTPTAAGYQIQRSVDGVNYTPLAAPTNNSYLDTSVALGTLYYYQVAGTNTSGTGPYSAPIAITPAPTAEMSLGELRLRSQQRADRVNSQFVTTPEWNFFIDQAMYELYDLLISQDQDLFKAPTAQFTAPGNQYIFPLPNGAIQFLDQNNNLFVAAPLYKLLGIDLAVNSASNAYVTVGKYMFNDRNNYVYPNTASTIYGVFNLQYRMMGTNIEFIPTPSGGQGIRFQYVPRLPQLLADTDITTLGFSGWLQYVIIRAAKYALDKEESDTTKLDEEIGFLKTRIEDMASNRDTGQPDRIVNVRQNGQWGSFNGGLGWSGPLGGF